MRARTAKRPRTARTADKHELYQESVQAPEVDAAFLARFYQRATGKPLRVLREDFCGTALLSCAFVKQHRENRAIGVDLHAPTLRWARQHNVADLSESQRQRLQLVRGNVLDVRRPLAELILAMNFSWFVFKTRDLVKAYVANAKASLTKGGLLVMDLFGGSSAVAEQKERRRQHGFDYVWDQQRFDPVSGEIFCAIHFEFRDGTRLRNAFTYDWRLWSIPELREIMQEVGFADVHVLWEGTDLRTGRGNGVYRRVAQGDADPAWLAYVVGRRP